MCTVQPLNSVRTPQAIGGPLDVDRDEAMIKAPCIGYWNLPYRYTRG